MKYPEIDENVRPFTSFNPDKSEGTSMQIKNLKPINKGFLVCSFDLVIPKWGNFVIHGCTLFTKNDRKWFTFPSFAIDDRETPGNKKYLSHCRFEEKETMDAFSLKVIPLVECELEKLKGLSIFLS